MATNPMQRKTRNAFLLGMLVMLLIAALVVALLYMKIQNQTKELKEYQSSTGEVYVLQRDVKSGQMLTIDMFSTEKATKATTPSDATSDVGSLLSSATLVDTEGRSINAPTEGKRYYYYRFAGSETDHIIYTGNDQPVTTLNPGDKAYFYADDAKTQKTSMEVSKANTVVAKIDMKANTIITRNAIATAEEMTTDDLRKEEYNVISLPVDLAPGEYVDVRLRLPNGQNYIVVSKKKVAIPVVNGQYLADTIQMNLTEEEILILSGAIVESYKTSGSLLYAVRYTEAGIQNAAIMTYYPSSSVQSVIQNDPNVVVQAIQGIQSKRNEIRRDIDEAVRNGNEDDVTTKTETSITTTQDARKNYLQTLPVIQ